MPENTVARLRPQEHRSRAQSNLNRHFVFPSRRHIGQLPGYSARTMAAVVHREARTGRDTASPAETVRLMPRLGAVRNSRLQLSATGAPFAQPGKGGRQAWPRSYRRKSCNVGTMNAAFRLLALLAGIALRHDPVQSLELKHLVWAGPLTVLASCLAVLLICTAATAILKPDPTFLTGSPVRRSVARGHPECGTRINSPAAMRQPAQGPSR